MDNNTSNNETNVQSNQPKKRKSWFTDLKENHPERMKEIAKRGGMAVARKGNGHKFSSEQAKAFGRLGGLSTQAKKRSTKQNQEDAA